MLHQIGVGALGPVFRTYEPERDRLVAVKVFRLDITPEQARALADELSRAAEAGLFHPSIVEPIAAGVEGSVAYNAEEYVAAESLDVAMRHYAPAQPATVLPFITQLAGAIDFARAAGVGHGALHPRDIFVTPEEARATGFGVVEALERVGLRAPVRRPYSPPERIAGGTWSTETDVFSLAAITYELLTGRRPAGLGREIGPLPEAEHVHEVLARAMDENPSRRYPTALAFASALEAAVRTGTAGAPATPRQSPEDSTRAGIAAAASAPSRGSAAAAAPPARSIGPQEDEIEDDVAAEREEDEAHHRLTEEELEMASAREAVPEQEGDLGLDEDSEIEAEADRYSGDDFLLDAAGAASAPAAELTALDDFGGREARIDRRALEDDELVVDEPPSPLFQPDDLRQHPEDRSSARRESVAAAPREQSEYSRQPAPPFAGYAAPIEEPEARSRWPFALTLLLGLLLGFAAGYAVWGRAVPPGGREWSEQAVSETAAPPSGAPAPASPSSASPAASSGPGPATATGSNPAGGGGGGREAEPARTAPAASKPPAAEPPPKPAPLPTTGTLVVRSTPSGAGVTINGRWRGRTPLTLEKLSFARYDIRVVQPGYAASREAITLSASDPARSVSLRLEPEARTTPAPSQRGRATARPAAPSGPERYTGAVFVDSRPRGARVFIDGKQVGVTPLSIPEIPIGSHVVRLELPDHRIWSTMTTVTAGQQARVTGSLERIQ